MKSVIQFIVMTGVMALALAVQAAKVSPTEVQGAKTVNAEQVKALWMQGVLCIDPRSKADWEAGRIPGALHMMSKSEAYQAQTVLRETGGRYDAPIVSYCNAESCLRAADLARDLVSWGFTNVHYFRDGFPAWKNAKYPYE
ncbi:MAG: rhodanese-like domain-containing protein [Thiomicrospira sp.]|jgi:rhodanese-related sulfurtransferase|nr:rhodanese-like domain-containing protein [Thiomicrospira sp.]